MQISNREICRKKSYQNSIWEGVGLFCWGVWNGLGRLLGTLGCLLPVFFACKIDMFRNIGPTWAPRACWDRFREGLGKVWEGLGKVFGPFLSNFI